MNNELLDFMTWVNQNKKLGYTSIGIERIVDTYTTSKERVVNQIIDEVYNNYLTYIHDVVQGENQIYGDWYGKEEFINKCKTDPEFREKWGLKIEERELSLEERATIWNNTHNPVGNIYTHNQYDENDIPTKLITTTKITKIESYE